MSEICAPGRMKTRMALSAQDLPAGTRADGAFYSQISLNFSPAVMFLINSLRNIDCLWMHV